MVLHQHRRSCGDALQVWHVWGASERGGVFEGLGGMGRRRAAAFCHRSSLRPSCERARDTQPRARRSTTQRVCQCAPGIVTRHAISN